MLHGFRLSFSIYQFKICALLPMIIWSQRIIVDIVCTLNAKWARNDCSVEVLEHKVRHLW